MLDEAHELDSEALAALLPMCSTRANPQVLYLLSQGNEGSWHLGGLRARALAGTDDYVTWVEWSMADDDDPADRTVWARCNPAYPARISMEYLEREFLALGVEGFARERLAKSSWPTDADGTWEIISEATWEACYCPDVSLGDPPGPSDPVPAMAGAAGGESDPMARLRYQTAVTPTRPWLP